MVSCRLWTLVVLLALPTSVATHPLTFTEATLTITTGGTFQVDMICDLDALALGVPQDTDDTELVAALHALSMTEFERRIDRLQQLFKRRVRVRFDGEPAPFAVAFPDYGTPRADEAEIPTVLGLTAQLTGNIRGGATAVEFFASRSFSNTRLTIVDESRGIAVRSVLESGARSDPFHLAGPVKPPTRFQIARQYLRMGVIHIVPLGLDHVLFVLGLFLLSTKLRPLVWQVTAFTVAHALTLTLATLGAVELSPRVIEPLIALSVAYIAIENMLTDRLNPWRPVVVFSFGLLHGLGFASVLRDLGLPEGEQQLALATFNLGIEVGQLAVIVTAFATLGWFSHRAWYRTRLVLPISAAIALVGIVWAVARTGAQ